MVKHAVFLLLLASWTTSRLRAQSSPELRLFQEFVERYNKPYVNDTETFETRFLLFKESLRRQQWLNSYEAANGGSAVYGVNKFSDLAPQEFNERYLNGLSISSGKMKNYSAPLQRPTIRSSPLPTTFDWRKKGVIGPVWNQEKCGSCWAFATVETITSRYAIKNGALLELSAQQLISCVTGPDLLGCNGGALKAAFATLESAKVVMVNAITYPFESGDDKQHTCKGNLPNVGLQLVEFNYTAPWVNETELKYYLVNVSPLTVSVNARAWQDYDGGIIQHHCDSSPGVVDHAVQVVGYDMTGPVPYWIVRNTWGTDWGEDGYLRLKFGQNTCGMTNEVVFVNDVIGIGL